jgi:SET domain-containing protein
MKSNIHIAKSSIKNAGRGVFASRNIRIDEIIEVCPILILWKKDAILVMETVLQHYVYEYESDSVMMALGYGSLYNNRDKPNAKYELQEYVGRPGSDSELLITAIRPIAKNEEIFIDYGIHDYLKTLKHSS